MKPLDQFASECTRWSDEYLLEQCAAGSASYAAAGYFDMIRAEVSRRGLPLPLTPTCVDPSAEPATRSSGSYFRRLWLGELPLATTYWGWGVGVNVLLAVLIQVTKTPDLAFLFMLLFFFSIGYYIFIIIAIWRSSEQYKGDRAWSVLARVSVILGVIRTVLGLLAGPG